MGIGNTNSQMICKLVGIMLMSDVMMSDFCYATEKTEVSKNFGFLYPGMSDI
jgi:hypothetical protein